MKRWKKVTLVVLFVLLLSQTPFIYRRYRLGRLHATIAALNAERAAPAHDEAYADYRGVFHVHSLLGGHSTGTFDEIVRAAKSNDLSFVVMTEHPSRYVDTAESTLKGLRDGVLFVNGSEINAAGDQRLFVLPGLPAPDPSAPPPLQTLVAQSRQQGRLTFIAYPEQIRDWNLGGYDGIEIYNLYTNSKRINYALLFFDGLWSYWSYPELLFATFYEKPEGNLKKWDELTRTTGQRLVALAGADAHQNVGLSFGQQNGRRLFDLKLDPYERSFRVVRMHVLVEKGEALSAETLSAALASGHCYIAFDLFCDAGGFRFSAESASERRLMGDEISLPADGSGVRLLASAPVKSRLVFLRDGEVLEQARDAVRKELVVDQKGVYRVEVYLDRLGRGLQDRPWVISNPIYVR
jgi:hypothetical protein